MKYFWQFILISLTTSFALEADFDPYEAPKPITYESLRAWHQKGGLKNSEYPLERNLDLNRDGTNEVFLATSRYSRGTTYALFKKKDNNWTLLADKIEASKTPIELLQATHNTWHDFLAIVPTWRGNGYWKFIYSWNGSKYVEISSLEVRDDELSEP